MAHFLTARFQLLHIITVFMLILSIGKHRAFESNFNVDILKATCRNTSEPSHEKTNNLCFRPGLTQIGLFSHRRRLED